MRRDDEGSNRRLLRARDTMDRTYAEPLDIASLARIALTSEAHFIRTFRMTDICLEVGFSSLGTFSRPSATSLASRRRSTADEKASQPSRPVPAELEDRIVEVRKELTDRGFDAGAQTIHYHLGAESGSVPSVATISIERVGWDPPTYPQWRHDRRFDWYAEFSSRLDMLDELITSIACPVLVVRGSRSPALSAARVRRLVSCMSQVRSSDIEGAGHNVQTDRPLELAGVIARFVDGLALDELKSPQ